MMYQMDLLAPAVLFVALYFFAANRLLVIGSHFRSRALDLGTQLLNDEKVPSHVKDSIEDWLCDIPKTWVAWVLNLLMLPVLVFVLSRRWLGRPLPEYGMPSVNSPYWKKWDDFMTMALIASLCNSPLALVLGFTQLVFCVSFLRGNYVVWVTVNRMIHHAKEDVALPQRHA